MLRDLHARHAAFHAGLEAEDRKAELETLRAIIARISEAITPAP